MYNINRERLIKTFVELVEIPSPSWKEDKILKYLINKFSKLGGNCQTYRCGDSFNLLVRFSGNIAKTPILLSGHMDTVVPCDKVKAIVTDSKITSDGSSVLGSDDKAAIAMFIEAFEYIKENHLKHGDIEILLTCAEEQGLKGIKGFDLSVLKSKYGFVFDSSGSIGRVIVKAPFHSNMEISIKGKASHAGMAPEKGINAIRVLSEIISSIPNGRIDEETTANVGLISGGRATNIVPEEATCNLEVRSIDKQKMLAVEKQIKDTVKSICSKYKAKSSIERSLEYAGFKIPPESKVCQITAKAMEKIGIKPEFVAMGGGSDTNIINSSGIKAVNLSCGMQNIHSTDEFILIKDLVNGTKLVLSIIENVP